MNLLHDAIKVMQERGQFCGPPGESFKRLADLANSIMPHHKFSPRDVIVFMMCLKLSREAFRHSRDNLVDLCAYADLLDQLYDEDEL